MTTSSGNRRILVRLVTTLATVGLLVGLMPASIVLAAPPGASLEQCRNGSATDPNDCPAPGGGSGWVAGNVGASQGHLLEGYSIPYRAVMTNLPTDGRNITIVLGYDIKHGDANALDYLTNYDRLLPHGVFGHSPESINPVGDISLLSGTTPVSYAIPKPTLPTLPSNGWDSLPASELNMTLWGGTFDPVLTGNTAIAYVAQGDLAASQSETTIAISFKATTSTVVLAWGGHIARGDEWNGLSASAISGSPYHMRTKSWNLNNLGNQDRSLSAGAVVNPPKLVVIKVVNNNYGGDAVPGDFDINVRDASDLPVGDPSDFTGQASPGTTVLFPDTQVYTVYEDDPSPGYSATYSTECYYGSTGTANVDQTRTCTITNSDVAPTLALDKTVSNSYGGDAVENDFVLSATPTSGTTITDAGGDVPATAAQSNMVYTLSETSVTGYTPGTWSCSGSGIKAFDATTKTVSLNEGAVVTCAITNSDVAPTLALDKTVSNSYGGDAVENDFVLSATPTSGTTITDAGGDVPATAAQSNMVYTLSETSVTGYTPGTWSCSGSGIKAFDATTKTVSLNEGAVVTCAITNSDVAPTLALDKTVSNLYGGDAVENDFVLSATPTSGTTITDAGGDVPATAAQSNMVYTLSETSVTGYTPGTWSCSGSGIKAFDATTKTVSLNEGAVVTCAITNSDSAAQPTGKTVQHWVLHDTISISGIRSGGSPAATVTFRLYSDSSCLVRVQVGDPAEDYEETSSIDASGVAVTTIGATVFDTGTYYWRATYSGDSYNEGFTTDCGQEVTQIFAKDDLLVGDPPTPRNNLPPIS